MKRTDLKPGKPPERKTPLARSQMQRKRVPNATQIANKRSTFAQSGSHLSREVPLNQRSRQREAADKAKRPIREAVFRRDGGCVLQRHVRHACFGGLTVHHIVKESQGGPYTLENLVALCAWANCTWVEQNREEARTYGLHRDSWEVA